MDNIQTRKEWNRTTSEMVSNQVGGAVEVALMNDTISIYTETSKAVADSALRVMKEAGSELVSYTYYEEDEDGCEAWAYEVTL